MSKVLIYGYGNPGRQDDGLGVSLAEQMERWGEKNALKSMDFESNYQLNIEDSLLISEYDLVVFADASVEEIPAFSVSEVIPEKKNSYTMHNSSPGYVLYLCQSMYRKYPAVFLMHLRGYGFDFMQEMTSGANNNLRAAVDFLQQVFSHEHALYGWIRQLLIYQQQHKNNIRHESRDKTDGAVSKKPGDGR